MDLDPPTEEQATLEDDSDFADKAKDLGLGELLGKVDALSKLGNEDGISALPETKSAKDKPDLKKLLTSSLKLPEPDVSHGDLASQVTFINETYEGKHVVYLIDVGSYQIEGTDGVIRMEK